MTFLLAVFFDFRGVIVDHENDRDLVPGIEDLLRDLKAKGTSLAVISSFGRDFVKTQLGQLSTLFDGGMYTIPALMQLELVMFFASCLRMRFLSMSLMQ